MPKDRIRVALAGVGSCASSLVQWVHLLRVSDVPGRAPGVSHPHIGSYRIPDLEFVAAFDVDERKVGEDLSTAVFAPSNAASQIASLEPTGVRVLAGPLLDGIDGPLSDVISPAPCAREASPESVAESLAAARADVLVCIVPTGAGHAVRAYAKAAAMARVSFVNATPEPVAVDPAFQRLFRERNAVLLGDDLRSHLGATALHGALLDLMRSRGILVERTHQLNVGGNADFMNLSSPTRARSKVASKRRALGTDLPADAWAGPAGFVPHLGDHKICHLRIDGRNALGSPVSIELRLEVEDSPNAAAVLVNAVRCAQLAREAGQSGVVEDVCPYLFKSATISIAEHQAQDRFNRAIEDLAARCR